MSDHIFFDMEDLKHVGKNVIIGKTVRIRYPELVSIGDDTVIDDYTYIATTFNAGRAVHIAPGCAFIGGRDSIVTMGDAVGMSANCTVVGSAIPIDSLKGHSWFDGALSSGEAKPGHVTVERFGLVTANCILGQDITIGEGGMIGAGAFVRSDVPAWEIWAGTPAKRVSDRSPYRENMTAMWERFARERYGDD